MKGPRPVAGAEVIDYECIGGCGGAPVSAGRARAVVWDGEKYCVVGYVLTMPLGPYCVSCIGRKLDRLNAAGAQRPAADILSPAARAMRRLRMERGLSYQEAGALLRIHPSNVCRAERGKRTPPAARGADSGGLRRSAGRDHDAVPAVPVSPAGRVHVLALRDSGGHA
jgi:hypothetical protein